MMTMLHQLVRQMRQAKQESDAWVAAGRRMTHWPAPLGWKAGLDRLHERLTVPNKIELKRLNAGKL